MSPFTYLHAELTCDHVSLARLADEFGTPVYVYSASAIRESYRRLAAAFAPLAPLICYAVKANSNLAVLRLLQAEGAGFDIVSGGELHRVLRAGALPAKVAFAGVGKTDAELGAALAANIGWFNVESTDELARLNALAGAHGQRASVALRLNPGVEPETHPHIRTGGRGSKFGLPAAEALAVVRRAQAYPALSIRGVHIHIGSQIPEPGPILRAVEVALDFVRQAQSEAAASAQSAERIDTLNIGGGFPVAYQAADRFPPIEAFAAPIVERLSPLADEFGFHLEPGRSLVAAAGALLTTIQAVKNVAGRRTLVVDAGLNALLRPALYGAYHRVLPLQPAGSGEAPPADIAGPICESADVLARGRALPTLRPGDRLAFLDVGAYGFSMASNYNSHPRPAEVLVDGGARLIRRRETLADLTALEEEEDVSS